MSRAANQRLIVRLKTRHRMSCNVYAIHNVIYANAIFPWATKNDSRQCPCKSQSQSLGAKPIKSVLLLFWFRVALAAPGHSEYVRSLSSSDTAGGIWR